LQKAFWQIWPPVQGKLQAPQLLMSLLVSTQLPLQSVEPEGQPNTQVPAAHESPVAQALPQLPQFIGSVLVFTHALPHWVSGGWHFGGVTHIELWQTCPMAQQAPLQSTWPDGQLFTQLPPEHDWFWAQVRLQAPQLDESELRLTQRPLQFVRPVRQPLMQLPWLQKVPAPQTLPQLPQLLSSFEGSMQALLQKSCPVGQAQLPLLQISPVPQTLPQEPQFCGSVLVSTQALEQLVSPLGHPDWQSDPLHTGLGGEQVWLQLPQLFGLLVRLTQMPPQLVSPLGQTTTQPPP
jgi:hypothetical protein